MKPIFYCPVCLRKTRATQLDCCSYLCSGMLRNYEAGYYAEAQSLRRHDERMRMVKDGSNTPKAVTQ